jgi:hypothetical protein
VFGRRRKRDDQDVLREDDVMEVETEEISGPYDSADAPDDDMMRLDLGSLRIPALPGLKVGMPADDSGRLRQEVVISNDDSVLRLAVCAAPRSEGIWDEVREEIAASVAKQGGRTEEVEDGPYGVELVAHQPAGQQGTVVMRYIGIDGPRWFVRALLQGARASTCEDDTVLDECLRGLIVERGTAAMPVREGLPLQLPAEMLEEHRKRLARQQQAEATAPAPQPAKPAAAGKVAGTPAGRGAKRKPSPKPRKR